MVVHMPLLLVAVLLCTTALAGVCYGRLLVKMTLVAGADELGAGKLLIPYTFWSYYVAMNI